MYQQYYQAKFLHEQISKNRINIIPRFNEIIMQPLEFRKTKSNDNFNSFIDILARI